MLRCPVNRETNSRWRLLEIANRLFRPPSGSNGAYSLVTKRCVPFCRLSRRWKRLHALQLLDGRRTDAAAHVELRLCCGGEDTADGLWNCPCSVCAGSRNVQVIDACEATGLSQLRSRRPYELPTYRHRLPRARSKRHRGYSLASAPGLALLPRDSSQ